MSVCTVTFLTTPSTARPMPPARQMQPHSGRTASPRTSNIAAFGSPGVKRQRVAPDTDPPQTCNTAATGTRCHVGKDWQSRAPGAAASAADIEPSGVLGKAPRAGAMVHVCGHCEERFQSPGPQSGERVHEPPFQLLVLPLVASPPEAEGPGEHLGVGYIRQAELSDPPRADPLRREAARLLDVPHARVLVRFSQKSKVAPHERPTWARGHMVSVPHGPLPPPPLSHVALTQCCPAHFLFAHHGTPHDAPHPQVQSMP